MGRSQEGGNTLGKRVSWSWCTKVTVGLFLRFLSWGKISWSRASSRSAKGPTSPVLGSARGRRFALLTLRTEARGGAGGWPLRGGGRISGTAAGRGGGATRLTPRRGRPQDAASTAGLSRRYLRCALTDREEPDTLGTPIQTQGRAAPRLSRLNPAMSGGPSAAPILSLLSALGGPSAKRPQADAGDGLEGVKKADEGGEKGAPGDSGLKDPTPTPRQSSFSVQKPAVGSCRFERVG